MIALLVATALADELVLTGAFTEADPDYLRVPFVVGSDVEEIAVAFEADDPADTLDFGLEGPDGWRGWSGSHDPDAATGTLAASRSYTPGPMPGDWNLVVGRARASQTASFRATIQRRSTATLTPDATAATYSDVAPLREGPGWFAGDLHVHSEASGDAVPSLDAIAELAEARGLDFVVLTDHNTAAAHQRIQAAQARHPTVLLIPGLEVTTYEGHVGAAGVSGPVPHTLGLDDLDFNGVLNTIHERDGLTVLNHPELTTELCIGCAFTSPADPAGFDAIEVVTGSWDKVGRFFTPAVLERWESLADDGVVLAAVGGSDDHRAGQDLSFTESPIGTPTTLVYASALSAAAILDGIAAHRTSVLTEGPDGARLVLEPGDAGRVTAAHHGAEGLRLRWVVNGASAGSVTLVAEAVSRQVSPGSRIRAELYRGDDLLALTSFYQSAEATVPDTEPCGCRTTPSTITGLLPLWLLWRRRRL